MQIQPGQTYRAADPRDSIRIRIKSYIPGENRALVVDAATGKRPRPMLVTALHTSPTTQAGKPRRSGYVLEQPTAARQTTEQDDTWPLPPRADRCPEPECAAGRPCWRCDYEESQHAARQPDPTTADDPTPLRWGLGDILHSDDDTVTVCLSGLDRKPYWLELDAERAAAFRQDLTPPATEDTIGLCGHCGVPRENHHHGYTSTADVIAASPYSRTDEEPAPAVGQPAEAHGTALRERLRLAIAQQYLADTGSGRTVDELDDTEFGSLADAALSVLTVEDER